MRIIFICVIFCTVFLSSTAQVGVSANSLSEFAVDYKIKNRLRLEMSFLPGEMNLQQLNPHVKLDVMKKDMLDAYVGIGLRGLDLIDVVSVPIGMDIYPFAYRNLSVVIEAANYIGNTYDFTGSIGFRYRFGTKRELK